MKSKVAAKDSCDGRLMTNKHKEKLAILESLRITVKEKRMEKPLYNQSSQYEECRMLNCQRAHPSDQFKAGVLLNHGVLLHFVLLPALRTL